MRHLRSVNLNLLPILRELLAEESVTRAANVLHMSQSATSEALGRLREVFADPLLLQTGRRMQLTPFARDLVPVVEEAMKSAEYVFSEQAFDASRSERKFTIETVDMIVMQFGAALSNAIVREAPNVRLQFFNVRSDVPARMAAGEVDFAILAHGFINSDRMRSTPLLDTEHVCVADAANGLAYEGMPLADYCKLRHIVFSPSGNEQQWDTTETRMLGVAGVKQRNVVYVPYFSFLPFLVAGTENVALVHRFEAMAFRDMLNIKIFSPPTGVSRVAIHLYWSQISNYDPAHRWFRKKLETVFAESNDDST